MTEQENRLYAVNLMNRAGVVAATSPVQIVTSRSKDCALSMKVQATDMKPPVDPKIADFVKALARANAARDIAKLQGSRSNEETVIIQGRMRAAPSICLSNSRR